MKPDLNRQAADELRGKLAGKRSNVIALLGAGASADCYPTWNELTLRMHKLAIKTKGKCLDKVMLCGQINDAAVKAHIYRKHLPPSEYRDFIRTTFTGQTRESALMREIVKLPVEHFLTTNYEELILDSARSANEKLTRILWTNDSHVRKFFHRLTTGHTQRCCVYLHGSIRKLKDIILTEQDYLREYVRSELSRRKLFVIFSTRTVLSIGFSLTDPDLMYLQREAWGIIDSASPRHFAIIPWSLDDQAKEKPEMLDARRLYLETKYGIQPIFYPVKENPENGRSDHSGLHQVLRYLRGENDARLPELAANPLPPAPTDELDPQKGRWGGRNARNHRTLTAKVTPIRNYPDWFNVALTVRGTARHQLNGYVKFHLHSSFYPMVRRIKVKGNQATLELEAWGAFTVGAVADNGETKLELDLAGNQVRASALFKSR